MRPHPLRIVFMGTAELATASLRKLHAQPTYEVVGVVTQPDRPSGRDLRLSASPVKQAALSLGLAVMQPERARHPDFIQQLSVAAPDLIVVAAYGQILPPAILNLPRYHCLNVHTSLLPKYRGAAPIQWALLNGDSETGVTIMKMDAGLDTGDILTQQATAITPEDNASTLHDRLATMGADLLHRTIPDYVDGKIVPRVQPPTGATHARKITREDGHIDWSKPAGQIWNQIRAFTPWPGAHTARRSIDPPQLLKIWTATISEATGPPGQILRADADGIVVACGSGALVIHSLQREGRKRLAAGEFLAGTSLRVGESLG